MMVFITHPKYFDVKVLDDKDVDVIYIFNGKRLYNKLKEKYKVALLGNDYKIVAENFFSQEFITHKNGQRVLYNNKELVYKFLHKIKRIKKRDDMFYNQIGYKQDIRFHLGMGKRNFKKDPNLGIETLDLYIKNLLIEIFSYDYGVEYLKKYKKNAENLLNLTSSFYRIYVQSLGYKRGIEIVTELNKYSYLVTVMDRYRFNRWDVYKDGFNYGYLKVLSRVFIEQIYKESVKEQVKKNVLKFEDMGWF